MVFKCNQYSVHNHRDIAFWRATAWLQHGALLTSESSRGWVVVRRRIALALGFVLIAGLVSVLTRSPDQSGRVYSVSELETP